MNKKKLSAVFLLGVITSFATFPAVARTDVKAKVQQINENAAASQANLEQYQSGLRVVTQNLADTDRAIKTIEKQKVALTKQTGQSAKDKMSVDAARAEVEGLLSLERDRLTTEEKQIEDLQQALQRLEANKLKRQENIVAYEERIKTVDAEKSAWVERSESVGQLEEALRSQEAQAREERKRLAAKKAEYEEEIEKWKKQVRVSQRSASNFGRLKEP